jgi:hypothetical protein
MAQVSLVVLVDRDTLPHEHRFPIWLAYKVKTHGRREKDATRRLGITQVTYHKSRKEAEDTKSKVETEANRLRLVTRQAQARRAG